MKSKITTISLATLISSSVLAAEIPAEINCIKPGQVMEQLIELSASQELSDFEKIKLLREFLSKNEWPEEISTLARETGWTPVVGSGSRTTGWTPVTETRALQDIIIRLRDYEVDQTILDTHLRNKKNTPECLKEEL